MAKKDQKIHPQHGPGLFQTLWPSDHGNTARQKFVVDGGLPKDLDPEKIAVENNPDLPYPQWMYTRNQDEIFVYAPPGNVGAKGYFAKVDSQTLAIKQRIELPQIIYIGGALMHENGDVYLMHGKRLYRFPDGDLDAAIIKELPEVNGFFTQSNGMLVGHDGKLIIKMWALTHHELEMIRRLALLPIVPGLIGGLALGSLLGAGPKTRLALGLLTPAATFLAPFIKTQTSLREFFNPTQNGHILVVDPETLEVVQSVEPPERVAFARMCMTAVNAENANGAPEGQEHGGEWVIMPGDEHIMRWHYHNGQLTYDENWSERYRTWGDGSFPGTGPSIYNRQVYYTDNTFPVGLASGYRLYRKSLDDETPQQKVELSDGEPGFMFWSTVSLPDEGAVIVWDTNGAKVEARDLEDLSLKWQSHVVNTDCISAVPSRGHVYAVDHSEKLNLLEILRSVSRRPAWPNIEKYFVVLDAKDGSERLRVPLGQASPNASLIMPGYHNDVFVGSRRGLFRIHQKD